MVPLLFSLDIPFSENLMQYPHLLPVCQRLLNYNQSSLHFKLICVHNGISSLLPLQTDNFDTHPSKKLVFLKPFLTFLSCPLTEIAIFTFLIQAAPPFRITPGVALHLSVWFCLFAWLRAHTPGPAWLHLNPVCLLPLFPNGTQMVWVLSVFAGNRASANCFIL